MPLIPVLFSVKRLSCYNATGVSLNKREALKMTLISYSCISLGQVSRLLCSIPLGIQVPSIFFLHYHGEYFLYPHKECILRQIPLNRICSGLIEGENA